MAFTLTSSSFRDGERFPSSHTCAGHGASPPLAWQDLPRGTESLVLLFEDLGPIGTIGTESTFVHWVVCNIAPWYGSLPLGGELPRGSIAGHNDAGGSGYFPPCPSEGCHRYAFKLHALDCILRVRSVGTKEDLASAISRHVLDTAELTATYPRD